MAYEPVQSLLAVGTRESRFGSGKVYVFGRRRVSEVFDFPRPVSVKTIQFCADRLIVLDSKNDLVFFSLASKRIESSYSPPGVATSLLTDPVLDFAFVGLQSGWFHLTNNKASFTDG